MESDLGRRLADSELAGDRLVREVVHIAEHDHHAQLVRKTCKGRDESLPVVRGSHGRLGITLRARLENLEIVVQLDVRRPPAFGDERRRAVHGDAMQPGLERRVATELAQRAERSQIGLLEHVPGVVLVADETQRQGIAVRGRGAHQVLEGCAVPVAGRLDELGEVVELSVQRVSL